MDKAIALIQKLAAFRGKGPEEEIEYFDRRLKRMNRARQVSNAQVSLFKNRSLPLKA